MSDSSDISPSVADPQVEALSAQPTAVNRPQLVIYHASCWDGITSAYILQQAIGNGAEIVYVPWSYDHHFVKIPWQHRDAQFGTAYVLDIGTTSKLSMQLSRVKYDKLIWIDHHIGAPASCERDTDNVSYVIDTTCSCTKATWRYFHADKPVPYYVDIVNNHDLFVLANSQDEAVRTYLFHNAAQISFAQVKEYFDMQRGDDRYINIVRSMIKHRGYDMMMNLVKNVVRHESVKYQTWKSRAGEFFVVLTSCSEPGNLVLREQIRTYGKFVREKMQQQLDFIVRAFVNRKKTIVMLRAVHDKADAQEVAAKYGGGGHRGAATFAIDSAELDMDIINVAIPSE